MKYILVILIVFVHSCNQNSNTQKKENTQITESTYKDSTNIEKSPFLDIKDSKGRNIWGEWTYFFVKNKDTMIYKRWDANTPQYIANRDKKTIFIEYGQEHYLYEIKNITIQKDTFLISATQENSPEVIFLFKCFLLDKNTALWKNKYMFEGFFTRKGDKFKIIKEETPIEEEDDFE